MKQPSLDQMSVDELVNLFEKNAIEQDRVTFKEQVSKYKMVFGESDVMEAELEKRGAGALRALMRLSDNSNMQVRLRAACMTVAVAPAEARSVLEKHCALWPCASISRCARETGDPRGEVVGIKVISKALE